MENEDRFQYVPEEELGRKSDGGVSSSVPAGLPDYQAIIEGGAASLGGVGSVAGRGSAGGRRRTTAEVMRWVSDRIVLLWPSYATDSEIEQVQRAASRLDELGIVEKWMYQRSHRVQTWIHPVRHSDGTYSCFGADQKADKLIAEVIEMRVAEAEERAKDRLCGVTMFPYLILPSLVEYFQIHQRPPPPYTAWRSVFAEDSSNVWCAMGCDECKTARRVKWRYHGFLVAMRKWGVAFHCDMVDKECDVISLNGDLSPLNIDKWRMAVGSRRSGAGGRQSIKMGDEWGRRGDREEQEEEEEIGGYEGIVRMHKALGKAIPVTTYSGSPEPNRQKQWQQEVEQRIKMYGIAKKYHVTAAVAFLSGEAKDWWTNLCVTGEAETVTELEDLYDRLRKRFHALDRAEQLFTRWVKLQQRGTVEKYREEVMSLQANLPLGEKAEFHLANQGLRSELKCFVRQEMDEENIDFLPLQRLFVLARRAEIGRGEVAKSVDAPRRSGQGNQGSGQVAAQRERSQPSTGMGVGLWERQARTQPCKICERTGHLIRECKFKKPSGCFRCGEKGHGVHSCPQLRKREEGGIQRIGLVEKEKKGWSRLEYQVKINQKPVTVMIDTGADCSAIDREVAEWVGLECEDVDPERAKGIRGAAGQALPVVGRTRAVVTGEGQSTAIEFWVIDGLKPSVLLGLPWIYQAKPQIRWEDGALIFPNGREWRNADDSDVMVRWPQLKKEMKKDPEWNGWLATIQLIDGEKEEKIGRTHWKKEVQAILKDYDQLFQRPKGEPPTGRIEHEINLAEGAKAVMKRPYRLSATQAKEVEIQLKDAWSQGWIQPSKSPWGTAVVMVPKKDGRWRVCVDYRDLNAVTIHDAYPLPRVDELLHKLADARVYSRLDLESGFHQIWIREEDRQKTAFRIGQPVGGQCHFEWRVMPFGLRNAPATFQRYMTHVMAPVAAFTLVYMDDVLVYSKNALQHEQHLREVLKVMQGAELKVNEAKCEFMTEEIVFLGHQVSGGKISMEDGKKQAIDRWVTPLKTPKEARRFMGLVSYYRSFIPHFATLAEPIIALTRKRSKLKWTEVEEGAMREIQEAVRKAGECHVWVEGRETRLTTDASEVGMGAILEQQDEGGEWRLVAAASKTLTPCQRNYSTTDREWLSVVDHVTRVWRHWLQGRKFQLRTDHAPLRQLLRAKAEDLSYRQLRWYEKLEPFTFEVKYLPGKDNEVADALSRTPEFYMGAVQLGGPQEEEHDFQVTREAVLAAAGGDQAYSEVIGDRLLQQQMQLSVTQDGLLMTKEGAVCVPEDEVLRFKIMLEGHEPPFRGHFGVERTLAVVEKKWWWPRMKATVMEVVGNCDICQRDMVKKKKDEAPYKGLIANAPWEVVTIDFVSGFTPAVHNRHTACCVVCDRFTRMIHIESCKDHLTAREAAALCLKMVFARHGSPRTIVTDRGVQFDSQLWKELWRMMGTRVSLATTHHPQTNGLTERCNRTLISLIRKFTQQHPNKWAEMLPLFEFAYNQSKHSVTKISPFEAVYGSQPPTPVELLFPTQSSNMEANRSYVEEKRHQLEKLGQLVRQHEIKQQQEVQRRENERRGLPQFVEGDEVLMYWVPFSRGDAVVKKQRMKYEGPFRVVKVVSDGVVELEGLPSKMPTKINVEYLHLYKRDKEQWKRQLRVNAT